MTVLFLDVDGVLNNRSFHLERGHDELHPIDPSMLDRLNRVVEKTGCDVVLSSAWRYMGLKRVQEILDRNGAKFRLMDQTPRLNATRGREIKTWMYGHKVLDTQMAIVDDDSDMEDLMHRLVQTTFDSGLQEDHVARLIELLNEENEE